MEKDNVGQEQKQTAIKVFIRVRPLITTQLGTQQVVSVQEDNKTIHISDNLNTIQTKFDLAFNYKIKQIQIFKSFQSYIPKIVDGYNLTIFAYGQTGSGKTYTMFGNDWENMITNTSKSAHQNTFFEQLQTDQNYAGITPRAIYTLFKKINQINGPNEQQPKFRIFCSFLQIYNEKIYDLLQDFPKPKALNIHQSKIDGIFVEGLSQYSVKHYFDCLQLMKKGQKNRIIRHTSMNAKSSRSHTIFQILLESAHADGKGLFKKARLNLCDLAGSQKVNKSQQMGDQHFKQLKNINQSLTTLGKVIYSLSSGGKSIASFRQSKLTRLLQDSLTSNTFTFIIGNISPSVNNLEQTLNTLKFVERARHIVMKVKPVQFNGLSSETVIKLQKEILYLKQLLNLKRKGLNTQDIHAKLVALQEENQRLKKNTVSITQVQKLIQENRRMKMQIHKIQTTQYNQNQDVSDTRSSASLSSSDKKNIIDHPQQKRSDGFSLPLEKTQLFKKKNIQGYTRNSLVNAGKNVLQSSSFRITNSNQSNNVAETPQKSNQHKKQKQKILDRLQQLQRIQKFNQEKLFRQLEMMQKKHITSTPNRRSTTKQDIHKAQKKIINYQDKIKELEAKLFNK